LIAAWRAGILRRLKRLRKKSMDLGIRGKKAIVCAASKGLGKGCATALAREGVDVTICARGADALNATAKELGAFGVKVTPVVCDVTTEEGRAALLRACPSPDILINNAGGPPPGDFRNFSLEDWRKAVEGNMLITSASIKNPIASLELSNGARLGLTGAVTVLARKAAKSNVTINGILPGPFDTDRLRGTGAKMAEARNVPISVIVAERKAAVPAGRFGTTDEFGATVAFLCSAHAGFITAQNLLVDGGGYPGPL
jgi:3-oxoacyl-[acyl-carrier protein] reductase